MLETIVNIIIITKNKYKYNQKGQKQQDKKYHQSNRID